MLRGLLDLLSPNTPGNEFPQDLLVLMALRGGVDPVGSSAARLRAGRPLAMLPRSLSAVLTLAGNLKRRFSLRLTPHFLCFEERLPDLADTGLIPDDALILSIATELKTVGSTRLFLRKSSLIGARYSSSACQARLDCSLFVRGIHPKITESWLSP